MKIKHVSIQQCTKSPDKSYRDTLRQFIPCIFVYIVMLIPCTFVYIQQHFTIGRLLYITEKKTITIHDMSKHITIRLNQLDRKQKQLRKHIILQVLGRTTLADRSWCWFMLRGDFLKSVKRFRGFCVVIGWSLVDRYWDWSIRGFMLLLFIEIIWVFWDRTGIFGIFIIGRLE